MLRNSLAALAVAGITLLATPAAASAASPSDSCAGVGGSSYASASVVSSDDYTVDPGDTVTVTWQPGYFDPSAPVEVTTSGPASGGSQIATSGVASADGGLTASVTVATDVSGALSVAGWSNAACGGVTVQVAGQVDTAAVSSDPALAATGGTVPTVLLVSGAGALAFGLILLVARMRLRRRGQE